MIRNAVGQIQATEPSIRQIEMNLFAQPPLGPDAKAIPTNNIRISSSGSIDGRPVWL